MAGKTTARVFHGVLVAPCVVVLILAIVSFSSFAVIHNRFHKAYKKDAEKVGSNEIPDYCILFAKFPEKGLIQLSNNGSCVFAIWGEVAIAFLALLMGAYSIFKLLIGFNM